MKICIFGGGAVGSYLACHLAQVDGIQLSVVARGQQLAALRERGIRLIAKDKELSARVNATDDPSALGHQDYVFLTLKSNAVTSALASIESLLGPKTAVIPPTTGIPYWYFYEQPGRFLNRQLERIDPGGFQWKVLRPSRVIGCVFWVGAEVIGPGIVRQDGGSAGFPIGEPDGSESDRVLQLSKAMCASGISAPVRKAIRSDIWMKMINSACWNSIATLTLGTLGDIADSPRLVHLSKAMMREAEDVAAAFGVHMPVPMEKRQAASLSAREHKMSMLQDLEHARPLETETIVNSMETMRDLAGVETPMLDAVLGLLSLRTAKANTAIRVSG